MATTTKQAAIDNLQAIAQLIVQSPEAQIQEIVNKVGDQLSQLLQVDQQQGQAITTIQNDIQGILQQLTELPQLGDIETQQVLELIAQNMPEVAQLTLPTVTYRGSEYTLKAFCDMAAMQQGKKPVDYSEATYTPEGYLSSVLVKYDDASQETVTLTHTETDNGAKAIYIGKLPNAGGTVDAFEWHVGITRINSPALGLSIARHSDMQVMRLIGVSHLITWGDAVEPGTNEPNTDTVPPDDSGNSEAEGGDGAPVGLQDVPELQPLAGASGFGGQYQENAMGGGFKNLSAPNSGLYRLSLDTPNLGAEYAVAAAGVSLGTLTTDASHQIENGSYRINVVVGLQASEVLSVTSDAEATPFWAYLTQLDPGEAPDDGEGTPPTA